MSVSVTEREYPGARLVLFEEGDPVGVTAVQDVLSALWRMASERSQQDGENALARACLWNLVAYHSNPVRERGDSDGVAERIKALLEQVTVAVPARAIHLEEWRNEAAPESGKEVEAWVATHCLQTASGPNMVCCEQVNLAGYGEQGHSHFPALVRALLVPDLPLALLWLDDVPRKGRVLGQLLQMSDRMIVDAQHTTDPASLLAVNDLQRASPGKLADLGWLRLNPLRHLVAELFDAPERSEQLGRLTRILIETSPEGRNTGLLLVGWLLSRCGYRDVRAVDQGGKAGKREVAHRWQVTRGDGKTFPVDFKIAEGYGGLDGIFCIQLESGEDVFALHDVDPEHMSVQSPHRTLPRVALRESTGPELVAAALSAPLRDGVYAEALAMAAALVECEQWTQ